MKRCQRCHGTEYLRRNSSKVNKAGIEVINYLCKGCNTERLQRYRATEAGMLATRKAVAKSMKVNRIKQNARVLLNYHLKMGHVQKEECKCGSQKVEAHHNDYSKPLEVVWLCRKCHADLHRELKYGKIQ